MRTYFLLLTIAASFSLAACDRTTEEPPDTGARRDTGTDVGAADVGPDVSDLDVSVPDGGDGGEDCTGPSGCWSCAPTEPAHFLDGCTDSSCEPFPVTTARLPLLRADGTLPPLP